jgi:hypothetical protein
MDAVDTLCSAYVVRIVACHRQCGDAVDVSTGIFTDVLLSNQA